MAAVLSSGHVSQETAFLPGDRVGARVDLDAIGAARKSLYVTFGGVAIELGAGPRGPSIAIEKLL
jgi:hypothetical protein